jgi:predicted membrane protein
MKEKTILEKIRTYTLWAVLGSAALLLVLTILETWDVIETTKRAPKQDLAEVMANALMGGGPSFDFALPQANAWGQIQETLGIIVAIGAVVLLALLVSAKATLGRSDAVKAATAPAAVAAKPAAATAPAKKAAAKPKK